MKRVFRVKIMVDGEWVIHPLKFNRKAEALHFLRVELSEFNGIVFRD